MVERLPAVKVRIFDIVNGKFIAGDSETKKPSFLITPLGEKISRVNILGTVTDKFSSEDGNYSFIVLDDFTESIRVKAFGERSSLLNGIEIGDLVMVIGRIRTFGGEIYVNAEVIKKIEDFNAETLRKLEILKKLIRRKKIIDELKKISESMSKNEVEEYMKNKYGMDKETLEFVLSFKRIEEVDYENKILKLIENFDEGDGVEISKIFEILNLPTHIIESVIDDLWSKGKIYEPFPGKIKIVKE